MHKPTEAKEEASIIIKLCSHGCGEKPTLDPLKESLEKNNYHVDLG